MPLDSRLRAHSHATLHHIDHLCSLLYALGVLLEINRKRHLGEHSIMCVDSFTIHPKPSSYTSNLPKPKTQTITPQSPLDATTLQQQAPLRARRAHPGRQTRGRRRAISSEDELFLFRSLSFQGSGCKGSPGLTVRVQGIGASQPMAPASTSPTPKPNLSCQNEAEYDLRSKLNAQRTP